MFYEAVSGQAINFQKSEILFSKNTSEEDKEAIINVFQVIATIGSGKYLGMPSIIGRNKRAVFGCLRDRVSRKIHQ
jgi:hypothetical protein